MILVGILAGAGTAGAKFDPGESYDGTVASFRAVDPPRQPEPFTFRDTQDRSVSLADFRGKIVLVNLWATWCPPCLRELPALDRLQAAHGGKDFIVLAISVDRLKRGAVEVWYKKLRIDHLGLYLDPWQSTRKAFRLDALPANYILGRDGRILAYMRSFADWDAPEAAAMIRDYVAGRRP